MKKMLLGTVAFVTMAAPAVAADLPARPYRAPPPVVVAPIYDWTGFYIGGNGGWGQANNCWDVDLAGVFTRDNCLSKSGGLIGGQVGYRWQVGPAVFGVEAQGDWTSISNSHVSVLDPNFTESSKVNGLGLFTGQVGYTWGPGLLYFKGGGAVTSSTFSLNSTLTGLGFGSISSTRWGGSAGVGFEYLFTPNWSVGLEYDHLFMGNANNTFSVVSPVFAGALNRIDQNVDMFTIRFNYKFGGAAPLVARY